MQSGFKPYHRAPQSATLFWLLPLTEQHERIRKLAASRLNAATIASITKLSAAEVLRIIEAR